MNKENILIRIEEIKKEMNKIVAPEYSEFGYGDDFYSEFLRRKRSKEKLYKELQELKKQLTVKEIEENFKVDETIKNAICEALRKKLEVN